MAAIPITLSVVALIFSIYVFVDNHRKDRRDVLLKMHELLISDRQQRGRYLLFERVVDEESVEQLSDEEYRDINGAIAALNLLGLYLRNGYVDESDVLDAWGVSIVRSWAAAKPFLSHREDRHGYNPHRDFKLLAEKAEGYLGQKGIAFERIIWRRSGSVGSGPSAATDEAVVD